jgi:hypothetical protein
VKLDDLKTLLNFTISKDGKKLPCYKNEDTAKEINCFLLFYTGDDDAYKIGHHTAGGYYSVGVQIAARHNDYDKSRDLAYTALEYINVHSKNNTDGYFTSNIAPPVFVGLDDRTGGYIWAINTKIKGAYK